MLNLRPFSNTLCESIIKSSPFLSQETCGVGTPYAMQERSSDSPTLTEI